MTFEIRLSGSLGRDIYSFYLPGTNILSEETGQLPEIGSTRATLVSALFLTLKSHNHCSQQTCGIPLGTPGTVLRYHIPCTMYHGTWHLAPSLPPASQQPQSGAKSLISEVPYSTISLFLSWCLRILIQKRKRQG